MTTTPNGIRNEVVNFLDFLIESRIAVHTTAVTFGGGRITWRPYGNTGFLATRDDTSMSLYRSWLEAAEYSALLSDASMLQISYDFAAGQLVGHRLAYIPCPFDIDKELLEAEPHVEVF